MQEKEQKISPIKQRILQFADNLNISKREFYAKIGVSRGTLESKTGITEDVLAKFIATFPDVSIEWLMQGKGRMKVDKEVVDNVATAIAIHEAITLGKPLYERVVTVTGDAIKNPGNFKVKNGTNAAELVEAAGGFQSQPEKVISGGPMMGMALSTLDVPCAKTFSSLLCFTKDEVAACEPSNCIRCGRCISVCPAGLMPTKLSEIADHGDFALFDELNGCECVECGCCSYICPAKRRLTQSMKTGRREAMALRRKKK